MGWSPVADNPRAMINHSVLLTGFAALALGQRGAQATCIACDPSEENVLLQHSHASEDGAALGAGAERWRVHGYPKWNCEADVHAAQQDWKDAILDISAAYRENTTSSDFVTIATEAIQALYGYDIGPVTFKPTLAVDQPFRPTAQGALSYFVGNDATNDYAGGGGIPEDSGFAIAGGDTWSKVLFFNDQISCVGDVALAQGYYYFTNATSKQDVGVEYTFVYKKIEEGQLKIIVHHSSLPAPVSLPAPASATLTQKGENLNWKKGGKAAWPMKPVWWHGPGHFKPSYGAPSCEERVAATQEAWKYAILNISEAFRQNALYPNYVQLAADTIDKLYNYDNGKVLFKPTLAAQDPFRDDFIGALSYFVGYEATKEQGGFPEDSGFAIKGGETWSNVTFENNLTNCVGDVALSQGYYYFTAADSGNITGVEYSFVYKQMKAGELKIIAHHSSLPADQV